MKLLVTGATGNLGSKVVDTLLKTIPADQIVVSVRDLAKAEGLKEKGVDVRYGDYDKPETLDSAFSGVDRLLLISSSEVRLEGDVIRKQQHANVVAVAKRAGVKFIAFTSAPNAQDSAFFLAPAYKATEETIIQSGIPYSFLRNNWYLENESGNIQGAMAGLPWVTATGEGKVGWALQQDFAEAAAAVLAGEGHENTIYELSGKLMTHRELVAELEAVLEKEIPFQPVSDEAYADIMKGAGVPETFLPMMVNTEKGIREGGLAVESTDFEKVLGRPLAPMRESLEQLVQQLSQAVH